MDLLPIVDGTARGACWHDCPDTCSWEITVQHGRAVRLRGDRGHPFTSGGLCAKVNSYLEDRLYSPDRLLHPLRRNGPKGQACFEQVSWDEALDDIANRLRRITDQFGGEAVLPYSYIGTQGMVQGQSMDRRFFALLGASRLERTICGDNGQAGYAAALGTSVGLDPEEIASARLILLWGTNTVVTNLHLWPFVLRARSELGAKVVVIDPVRTRTADQADVHVQLRPGSDAALAMAMMHVILEKGLEDKEYISSHTTGFDELRRRVSQFPPGRAAELTGLDEDLIVTLAREYATTHPAVIRSLVGMEHRRNGAATFAALACLPAVTGAWRHRGGGLSGLVGGFLRSALRMDRLAMPELEDQTLRSVNMLQLGQALTETTMEPPVKALVVYCSNPAVTAPHQNLVLEGLARDDLFTVVHEQFLTDTARYADYVLPATTQAEHLDLMYSWGHTYLALNRPAVEPLGQAMATAELFRQLAARMGMEHPAMRETDEEIIRSVLDSNHPYVAGITLERLASDGWAKLSLPVDPRPFADGGFPTPSGRCDLAALPLPDPQPHVAATGSGDELSLITAKYGLHFLNSSYGGTPRHTRHEKEPWLDLAHADALLRNIEDGDLVEVFNHRGHTLARARVGNRVPAGSVAMPSGWWLAPDGLGGSANALTSDGIDPVGRGGDFHDTLVRVRRAEPPDSPRQSRSPASPHGR